MPRFVGHAERRGLEFSWEIDDLSMESLDDILEMIVTVLSALGVFIMVWGAACAAIRLTAMEICFLRGQDCASRRDGIRQHLGFYLLLGLEFLIAVDVIETLRNPTLEQLGVLGGVVVVRTVISFSLHWELQHGESKRKHQTSEAPENGGVS